MTCRRRVGNLYLLSETMTGPTAGIIGEVSPTVAATLLASLKGVNTPFHGCGLRGCLGSVV
ncbi:hypothetical protein GCM10009556_104480 [Acrocarpospora pleiomorpha]